MIKIEIEGFDDLLTFLSLFKLDEDKIETIIKSLNESTTKLKQAEKEQGIKDAGSSPH